MIVEDLRGTARAGLLPVRGLLEVESSACPRGLGVAVYAEPDPEPLMPYPEDFGDPDEYERAAVAWEAGYEAACDAARTALARGLAAAGLSPGPALRGANAAGLSYAMAAISDTGEPEGLLLFPAALWLVQGAPSVPEERRRALVAEAEGLAARDGVPGAQAAAVARWLAGDRRLLEARDGAASGPEALLRVACHEVGHLRLAAAAPGLPAPGHVTLSPEPSFATPLGEALGRLEPPSLYACRSPHEWFAEAYTLWRCGEADAGNAELVEVAMRRLGWGG